MSAAFEANERFAAHTRSASFALALSSAQIDYLLVAREVVRLAEKYPWYRPREANFGTPEEFAVSVSSSTVRSLARRGLVDVTPHALPVCEHEVVQLTRAGELMCDLLNEAGFEVDPRHVPPVQLHPDDRVRLIPTGSGFDTEPGEPDRRDPADAPFLSLPMRQRAAAPISEGDKPA